MFTVISSLFSTTVVGILLLAVLVFVVRCLWKKKKTGGCIGCSCSDCVHNCQVKNSDKKQVD